MFTSLRQPTLPNLSYRFWLACCALLVGLGISGSLLGLSASAQQTAETSAGSRIKPITNLPTRPVLKLGSRGEAVVELQASLKLLGFYPGTVNGVYDAGTAQAVTQFQRAAGLKADGITGNATWGRLFPSAPDDQVATLPGQAPPASSSGGSVDFPVPGGEPANPAIAQPKKPAPVSPPVSEPSAPAEPSQAPTAAPTFPILRLGMRGPAVVNLQERLKAIGVYRGAIDGIFGKGTQAAVRAAQQRFNLKVDGVVGAETWSALMRQPR